MTETLIRIKNRLSDDEFFDLCQMNELRMERLSDRSIIIKPFNSLISSNFIVEVSAEIYTWNRKVRMGKCFASCTGFTFPNKAVFSPNFSWILRQNWEKVAVDLRKKFAPIAPDFVIEIRSETDSLKELQAKMQDYIANGVRLGWLMDRTTRITYIYRLDGSEAQISFDDTLSGEDVLVGFRLKIADVEALD